MTCEDTWITNANSDDHISQTWTPAKSWNRKIDQASRLFTKDCRFGTENALPEGWKYWNDWFDDERHGDFLRELTRCLEDNQ